MLRSVTCSDRLACRRSAYFARACAGRPERFRWTGILKSPAMMRTGQPVRATVQVTFKDGVPTPGTLALSKKSVELSAASGSAETTLNVDLPATETWSVSVLPANQKTRWLTVYPTSGRGPAQVKLTSNATGLGTGAYTATLVFQAEKTVPQALNLPVVFLVGNPGEGH